MVGIIHVIWDNFRLFYYIQLKNANRFARACDMWHCSLLGARGDRRHKKEWVLKWPCIARVLVKKVKVLVSESCLTLLTPQAAVHQAPLSMGFSRKEYWSGLPFPSPGDLPDPGMEPKSLALQADSFMSEPPGKPPAGYYGKSKSFCRDVFFSSLFPGNRSEILNQEVLVGHTQHRGWSMKQMGVLPLWTSYPEVCFEWCMYHYNAIKWEM